MSFPIPAILAAMMVLAITPTLTAVPRPHDVNPPLRVRFELADGVEVRGELTSWSADGIDGTFGPRAWTDLEVGDLYRLATRLIDRENADHWLLLGRALLGAPGGAERADAAFRTAVRLDPASAERVDAIRAEAAAAQREAREQERRLEAESLRTTSPEAHAWNPAVWPKLTAEQEHAAILTVRAESAARLEQFGLSWTPVDTGSFIIYTDLPREVAVRWTRSLERGLATLHRTLGIPSPTNLFWGKCIVYVFKDRDAFELVEAEAFRQLLPGSRHAICHFIGPQTFIVVHHDGDPQMFEWRLMRELTHAVMHRHHSPKRPPGWLNEGLALYIADTLVTPAAHKVLHRELALTFVREGGDVNDLFVLDYAHPKWPGPTTEQVRSYAEGADVAGLGPAVGALVCERLIGDAPDRFAAWIGAIKQGGSWDETMSSTLGTSREQLAAYIAAWYRVND